MKVAEIIRELEKIAPPRLQEQYDNAGLLTGSPDQTCTGVLVCLDATEEVVMEAVRKNCNMIVAHHPIIFGGLKTVTTENYVGKSVVAAIKNDIAIYAIHTNLDNIISGVNGKIAELLELKNITSLSPKQNVLKKLFTFAPHEHALKVLDALFKAGAGDIGKYSECSFNSEGTGTFKAGDGTDPFVGKKGERHHEKETKIEVIFPAHLESSVITSLKKAHPYEEVAYDVVSLGNSYEAIGSGLIGEIEKEEDESTFLARVKRVFGAPVIRHSPLLNRKVKRVALCGGAGSFLITKALASGADIYITADMKYHEFFDANERMVIADIGHYESEQFTINLLEEILLRKFPTFAILKTQVNTNPVNYFI